MHSVKIRTVGDPSSQQNTISTERIISHDRWSDAKLGKLAESVGLALMDRGFCFASAESCTGGLVAKLATDIAGSSAWFDRAFITYSNAAKQEMLGVGEDVLASSGAVSKETVEAMAAGTILRSRADIAVAISGIAGPGGATPGKPVGTVWLAWAGLDPEASMGTDRRSVALSSVCFRFDGNREAIRSLAAQYALQGILEAIEENI